MNLTVLLAVSNILLWLLVLGLGALVLALTRQIGVLHERLRPVGALALQAGPQVGDAAPALSLQTLAGAPFALNGRPGRDLLLFFLSPTCPVCKKLLPALRALAHSERQSLDLAFASDGELHELRDYASAQQLQAYPFIGSTALGMAFAVAKLPYAVLLDGNGVIRAKGLVNSREQIESLLNARALGVGSLQEFRLQAAQGAAARATPAVVTISESH